MLMLALIYCPPSQYWIALVGHGSLVLDLRDDRLWARDERLFRATLLLVYLALNLHNNVAHAPRFAQSMRVHDAVAPVSTVVLDLL